MKDVWLLALLSLTSASLPGRKPEAKLQSEECDYCSLGYSNTYCSYRSAEQSEEIFYQMLPL